ncbi:MAG: hypothetical protein KatS3mg082_1787 [Nitrospiraceae bacterium]|nr:MAG: hypothetical protein KatS3mg082_1787 [Nitrospiraceae bacterium]
MMSDFPTPGAPFTRRGRRARIIFRASAEKFISASLCPPLVCAPDSHGPETGTSGRQVGALVLPTPACLKRRALRLSPSVQPRRYGGRVAHGHASLLWRLRPDAPYHRAESRQRA